MAVFYFTTKKGRFTTSVFIKEKDVPKERIRSNIVPDKDNRIEGVCRIVKIVWECSNLRYQTGRI